MGRGKGGRGLGRGEIKVEVISSVGDSAGEAVVVRVDDGSGGAAEDVAGELVEEEEEREGFFLGAEVD